MSRQFELDARRRTRLLTRRPKEKRDDGHSQGLGEVDIGADNLWGAQTLRSLEHFTIGKDLIPREMIAHTPS
jgi:hypothetical protein